MGVPTGLNRTAGLHHAQCTHEHGREYLYEEGAYSGFVCHEQRAPCPACSPRGEIHTGISGSGAHERETVSLPELAERCLAPCKILGERQRQSIGRDSRPRLHGDLSAPQQYGVAHQHLRACMHLQCLSTCGGAWAHFLGADPQGKTQAAGGAPAHERAAEGECTCQRLAGTLGAGHPRHCKPALDSHGPSMRASAPGHKALAGHPVAWRNRGMCPRLFVPVRIFQGCPVPLADAQRRYLARVLRLPPGAAVVLFDGTGGEWEARWDGRDRAEPLVFRAETREAKLRLVLVQALVAREKLEIVVQKATELGVRDIVFVPAERSIVRMDARRRVRRLARLRTIAIEAAEQCGRTRIPRLALVDPRALVPCSMGLLLDPAAPQGWGDVADRVREAHTITLAIGPEGGWSDAERDLLMQRGFFPVRMGKRTWRTETAGLAALAAVLAVHPRGWTAEG